MRGQGIAKLLNRFPLPHRHVDVRILVQNSPTKTAVKGAHCQKYARDLSSRREIRWKAIDKG